MKRPADPHGPPTGTGHRLRRVGAAGAGLLARTAVAGVRKAGAGAQRREAIDAATRAGNAAQVFDVLGELKGPFLKVGQLLAQQPGVLPDEYLRRLADLQRAAPPMHGSLARLQIRNELGRAPEEVFAAFEREPFAAASLGQVHRARLHSGEEAAVKVQYPGIERSIQSDFALLRGLLGAAGWIGRLPALDATLTEVRAHIEREADYLQEAGAQEELARGLADQEDVRVPRVVRELSTRRVLTMERLDGVHAAELLARHPAQAERDRLAERLLDLFFRQTLRIGLFQADPHPGNFLFLQDGGIGLLDFGCTKRLTPELFAGHRDLYLIPADDEAALTACYVRLGLLDPEAERFPERLAGLLRMQRLDSPKYHRDEPFDFSDATYLREMTECLRDNLRLGLAHPDFVLYVRTKLGLYSLFHQLGARVSCRRALRAHL
jgi:predicted unusual protein kinase regulating ubiquinone biosynthesis (AarF/ABC1/UbiB family)